MSILDVFNFKKKFQEVATEENFNLIRNTIKEKIVSQVKLRLAGNIKMDIVVDTVITIIEAKIKSDNKIVQWIIDNILIKNIRKIAQAIYDDLKEMVEGL